MWTRLLPQGEHEWSAMLSIKRDPFLFYEISEEQLSTAFIHVLAAATTTGRRVSGLHNHNPWAAAEVPSSRPSPGGGELASRNLCPHSGSHPPPAPLQANGPRASRSGLVHLQCIQCQVLASLQTLFIPSQLQNPEPGQERTALGQRFSFPIPANSWESPHAGWTESTFTRQLGETLGWQRWGRGWGEWNTALTGFMRDTGPHGHQRYHSWHD